MNNKNSIRNLAQLLNANGAPGSKELHTEFLEKINIGLRNQAENRGIQKAVVDAIFEYVANHHCFDLDSQEKAKTIIETVFELVCPMAADDERSKLLLAHLKMSLGRRTKEL